MGGGCYCDCHNGIQEEDEILKNELSPKSRTSEYPIVAVSYNSPLSFLTLNIIPLTSTFKLTLIHIISIVIYKHSAFNILRTECFVYVKSKLQYIVYHSFPISCIIIVKKLNFLDNLYVHKQSVFKR